MENNNLNPVPNGTEPVTPATPAPVTPFAPVNPEPIASPVPEFTPATTPVP